MYRLLFWKMSSSVLLSKKVYRLLFWKISLFVLLSKKVYRLLFWKSLYLFYYQKKCTACYSEKFLHLFYYKKSVPAVILKNVCIYYKKKCTGCYSEKFHVDCRQSFFFFGPFFQGSKFHFRVTEWGEPVHYIILFLNISGPKLVIYIPSILSNLGSFCLISFPFSLEILQPRYSKFFTCCIS